MALISLGIRIILKNLGFFCSRIVFATSSYSGKKRRNLNKGFDFWAKENVSDAGV